MNKNINVLLLLVAVSLLTACVGKKRILFVTKTSVGVDVDSNPPAFDVGYGRIEASIAPVVDDGTVLPLLTSVATDGGIISGAFGSNMAHNFAIGNAALVMTKYLGKTTNPSDGERGDFSRYLDKPASVNGSLDNGLRYFFGTKTTFGFTTSFAAERAFTPDSIALGWKRKEIAYVPIRQTSEFMLNAAGHIMGTANLPVNIGHGPITYAAFNALSPQDQATVIRLAQSTDTLSIPSMIALAGAGAGAGEKESGFNVNQFYATGDAATYLAAYPLTRNSVVGVILNDQSLKLQLDYDFLQKESLSFRESTGDAKILNEQARSIIDQFTAGELQGALEQLAENGLVDRSVEFEDKDGNGDISEEEKRNFLKGKAQVVGNNEAKAKKLQAWINHYSS